MAVTTTAAISTALRPATAAVLGGALLALVGTFLT